MVIEFETKNDLLKPANWTLSLLELCDTVKAHNQLASNSISLIASGTSVSPALQNLMTTDLLNRAAEGRKGSHFFPGLSHYYDLEHQSERNVARVFSSEFAELRPISGSQANMVIFHALTKNGDVVFTPSIKNGGHVSTSGRVAQGFRNYRFVHPKLVPGSFTLEEQDFIQKVREEKPTLVIFGGSVVTESQDITEMVEEAHKVGAVVLYDASHVAGLIATGVFPNPINYGVDLMSMTTCKTIPGPSHAWIVGKAKYQNIIDKTIFPGFVSGGHLQEYVGALYALYEILEAGQLYGRLVVDAANTFGEILSENGFSVIRNRDCKVTATHQVLVDQHVRWSAREIESLLENINIWVNVNFLPKTEGFKSDVGIRFGLQEVVWLGFDIPAVEELARLIIDYLNQPDLDAVVSDYRNRVASLRKSVTWFVRKQACSN